MGLAGRTQIGHVYEGLLDHTAVKATEPVLGLNGPRDHEPEVPLSRLEALAAKGEDDLLSFVKEETGRSSVAPVKRLLACGPDDLTLSRFRTACQGDDKLWERIKPFAGLVRLDTFDYPVVILPRSVYVTAGTDRRSSGTHYTPEILTEPIVRYTLEPLVYEGPAEGKPREQWRLNRLRNSSPSRFATWRAAAVLSWSRSASTWRNGCSKPGRRLRSGWRAHPGSLPTARSRRDCPTSNSSPSTVRSG